MYERILVPLDGSKLAECVLPYVEELVSRLKPEQRTEVTLLQVISLAYHYVVAGTGEGTPVPYTDEELKPIKRSAASYLNKISEGLKSKGATVKIMVATGAAAEEIIRIADETKAGLIAISTHGRTGIARWVLGSVTDRVIRTTDVPVLVIRGLKVPGA